MDVTRTIWFEGSVDEFRTLQRMLEEEGVRVELPLWVHDREQTQKALDRVRAQLGNFSTEVSRSRLEDVETEEREDRRQLLDRQARERQELQQRHEREQQELEQSYRRQRQRLETGSDKQGQLQAQLAWILADVNQVIVSLVSTGATLAIAEAVK